MTDHRPCNRCVIQMESVGRGIKFPHVSSKLAGLDTVVVEKGRENASINNQMQNIRILHACISQKHRVSNPVL